MGVLIKAKANGYIDAVMPVVEELERKGIYFSDVLIARVKRVTKKTDHQARS